MYVFSISKYCYRQVTTVTFCFCYLIVHTFSRKTLQVLNRLKMENSAKKWAKIIIFSPLGSLHSKKYLVFAFLRQMGQHLQILHFFANFWTPCTSTALDLKTAVHTLYFQKSFNSSSRRPTMFLPMIIALISIILPSYFSLAATIDNTKPRRDIHGQLMDIHDGNVIKVGDLYHW